MSLDQAERDVLLGASVVQVGRAYRQDLIDAFGFQPDEVRPETFAAETEQFLRRLCRQLGERHAGDPKVEWALREWVMFVDHYEAWDALLSGFRFEGKEALVRRGQQLFPGPLTAHWGDDAS